MGATTSKHCVPRHGTICSFADGRVSTTFSHTPQPHLERNLGADDADKDANAVLCLVDLVGRPLDLAGRLEDDVRRGLKEQWDAIGEAVDIQAWLHRLAAQRHGSLHHKCMAYG